MRGCEHRVTSPWFVGVSLLAAALAWCVAGCSGGRAAHAGPGGPDGGGSGGASGGTCQSGRCLVEIAAGVGVPDGIAVGAKRVYWVGVGDPGVHAVDKNGGTPQLIISVPGGTWGVAVHGADIFWTDGVDGSVMELQQGTGKITVAAGRSEPQMVEVDDSGVYWSEGGGLIKVALGGGAPLQLANGNIREFALDATGAYWTDLTSHEVDRVGKDGSGFVSLATTSPDPYGVAADGTNVYWTDQTLGTVMQLPAHGGTPIMLASGQKSPGKIATDGTSVYWTNWGDGTVMKVPVGGGKLVTLASNQDFPEGITLDDKSAYWAAGGSIMKLTPR